MRIKLLALALTCAAAGVIYAQAPAPTAAPADAKPAPHIAWDWTGIIGTGQSLAVGQNASKAASTTQPYNNMKLDSDSLAWPVDPDAAELKLVPLVEPIGRKGTGGWPLNINGETPHAAMANEMTALVKARFGRDLISVHSEVGENGQGMQMIKKGATARGTTGRAYEATMIETKAITRLAKAAGKTFGIGAIIFTHGETDSGNAQYEDQMHQLWKDYNADLPAITGQTQKILMIVSQQHGIGNPALSTIAEWKAGLDYPDDIVCSGPKYQYQSGEGLHLTTDGYRLLGEKYAEVYFERVILGHSWHPLEPTGVAHDGKVVTVQFHVPVGPLAWDTEMDAPHAASAEWKNGKGFEVSTSDNKHIGIDGVEIKGDSVVISCASDPGANPYISYAMMGEGRRAKPTPGFARWGLLHDSDPFRGEGTGQAQPNYAVAFVWTAK